ncbi:MAG: YybH family protein [Planctomycetota bacterium]|jgi:ketosteroid isomerase-like protein
MNKSLIIKLGVSVLVAVLICGCQMGSAEKELINGTMAEWEKAFTDQDIEKYLSMYSDDYESERGFGKEDIRGFMESGVEEGFIENIEVDIENATTTIKGDKAYFSPVVWSSDRGSMSVEFTLQKEDGTWRIVSSKRQPREQDKD